MAKKTAIGRVPPKRKYKLAVEMQRVSDACHELSEYARDNGSVELALKCLREARQVAVIAVQIEQNQMTVGAAQHALLQIEHQGRIAEAKRRRLESITTTATIIPANGNGPVMEETNA